ncbi:MAG: Ohr family peroxiredoxin [Tunicatimonas sp.]
MKTMYESEVTSKGGLTGHVSSDNGALDVDVYMPEGEDDDKEGTTPEQLFAASYAACLEGTLYHVAKVNSVELDNTEVKATVRAVQVEKGDLQFALDLEVTIPEVDKKKAQTILDNAFKNCPLTKATKGNMEVNVELK